MRWRDVGALWSSSQLSISSSQLSVRFFANSRKRGTSFTGKSNTRAIRSRFLELGSLSSQLANAVCIYFVARAAIHSRQAGPTCCPYITCRCKSTYRPSVRRPIAPAVVIQRTTEEIVCRGKCLLMSTDSPRGPPRMSALGSPSLPVNSGLRAQSCTTLGIVAITPYFRERVVGMLSPACTASASSRRFRTSIFRGNLASVRNCTTCRSNSSGRMYANFEKSSPFDSASPALDCLASRLLPWLPRRLRTFVVFI